MDMGELPEGMDMPEAEITTPHPSASVILSRERVGGHEILLGHRVSEPVSYTHLRAHET